jgi:L-asparaginase
MSGHLAYFALGGTIAMTAEPDGGVAARLAGTDLLASLGELPAEVRVHDPYAVPSASLTFADVLDVVDAAHQAVTDGAIGIVLSQGTDTLEETAFLIDSVWASDVPFVVTGAMRNPAPAADDGQASQHDSCQVAARARESGRGVLVTFLDEIHAARHVRKAHSTSPATFVSPDVGPIGHVVEGEPRFLAELPARTPITGWTRDRLAATRIALYTVTLDDDGLLLAGPDHSHHGLVLAGLGVGHVPADLVPTLVEINGVMPVVLCSRTGAGSVLARTYSAAGSERDLRGRGLIGGGFLHPYKARVLLRLLVAAGATRAEIAAAFRGLG